jgi:hypothetical protein
VVVLAVLTVYVFEGYDAKYSDALNSAFVVTLLGFSIVCIVGTSVFATVARLLQSRLVTSSVRRWIVSTSAAAYPVLLIVLGRGTTAIWDIEAMVHPVIGWTYIIGFPAAVVLALAYWTRRAPPNSAIDGDTAWSPLRAPYGARHRGR